MKNKIKVIFIYKKIMYENKISPAPILIFLNSTPLFIVTYYIFEH